MHEILVFMGNLPAPTIALTNVKSDTSLLLMLATGRRFSCLWTRAGAGKEDGHRRVAVKLVEAAGQPVRPFRDGLDYAFILSPGCGACYPPCGGS